MMRLNEILSSFYKQEEYPCLTALSKQWGESKPLSGIKVLVATPIFRNTITEYVALRAAGAEIYLGHGGDLPYDPKWLERLRGLGLPTVCNKEEPFETDVVLDCAGLFANWPSRYGYVELTRSGVEYYAGCEKGVFLADSGNIKRIETVLGTGESYFRAMATLGYSMGKGKRLVVFGSGKVGSGLILQGFGQGMEVVVVTEPETIEANVRPMIREVIGLTACKRIEEVVMEADYLVMATGVKGAFGKVCNPSVLDRSTVVCANMGVEDEFGESVASNRIVQQKRAVNFLLEEPTHLKYIDATLALHAYGAIYLKEHPEAKGIILPPSKIERELIEITLTDGTIGEELRRCGLV